MAVFLCVLAIELFLTLLVAPIGVRANIYFSLGTQKSIFRLKVAGINVLKIKLEIEKGALKLTVNGKKKRRKEKSQKIGKESIPEIFRFIKHERLLRAASSVALIGGEDASDAAMNCSAASMAIAALPLTSEKNRLVIYPDFENSRLDADLKLKLRTTAIQILRLIMLFLKGKREV